MFWLPFIAGGVISFLVVHYWDKFVEWLSDFLPKVAAVIRKLANGVEYATEVVADWLDSSSVAMKHRLYHKEGNNWIEETTTRQLPDSELPPRIRKKIKVRGQEEDISREIEAETGLTV